MRARRTEESRDVEPIERWAVTIGDRYGTYENSVAPLEWVIPPCPWNR